MEQQPDAEQPNIQWPEWRERRKGERRAYQRRASDQVQGDIILRLLRSEYDALAELGHKFGYEDASHFAEDLIRALFNHPPSEVMPCLESLFTKPTK